MLCRHCGATTSAALDRCDVCRTPNPAREPAATAAGFDSELTWSSSGTVSPADSPGSGTTRIRRHGRGLSRLGWKPRRGGRAEADSRRSRRAATGTTRSRSAVQARAQARAPGHAPKRGPYPRPRRGRGHALPHHGVRAGSGFATLFQREPTLPLPRALALARQIASGLASAHRAGIVHRGT